MKRVLFTDRTDWVLVLATGNIRFQVQQESGTVSQEVPRISFGKGRKKQHKAKKKGKMFERMLEVASTADSSQEKLDMQRIAHHVWQLKRSPSNIFNVYLIEDVLIDTATRWDAPSLLKQLANIPLSQVALTHCHPDHQGAVKRICETRGIPLACHEADVASMEGRVRMRPRNVATQLIELAFAGPAYPVQRVLHEGDEIAGFRVIHTPGHTA